MELYTASPNNTPWTEVVKGSQGSEQKPREDHIMDEFNRLEMYAAKGDIATLPEVLRYFSSRDRGFLDIPRGSKRLVSLQSPSLGFQV